MQTYIVIVSGSILNVSTVHLNGIWHLIWRYLSKPVLGGHPVLSEHYSIPRGCPRNTGFTVYEVLHDVHTIKIHDHCFNAEIIYTSKNAPENVLRKTTIHILRKKRGTYQTKAQKRSKDHFIQEIWWPIQESGRSVPYPGELARMLLG